MCSETETAPMEAAPTETAPTETAPVINPFSYAYPSFIPERAPEIGGFSFPPRIPPRKCDFCGNRGPDNKGALDLWWVGLERACEACYSAMSYPEEAPSRKE